MSSGNKPEFHHELLEEKKHIESRKKESVVLRKQYVIFINNS